MGVDAIIWVMRPGEDVWRDDDAYLGRYYDEEYPRGHWPKICARLMELMKEGYAVKYFGDHQEVDDVPVVTPLRVLQISAHYLEGNLSDY